MLYVFLALLVLILWHRLQRDDPPREEILPPDFVIEDRGAGEAVREMVQDPICQAFVAKATALTTVGRGRVWFFCSSACYRRFLLENARASGQ